MSEAGHPPRCGWVSSIPPRTGEETPLSCGGRRSPASTLTALGLESQLPPWPPACRRLPPSQTCQPLHPASPFLSRNLSLCRYTHMLLVLSLLFPLLVTNTEAQERQAPPRVTHQGRAMVAPRPRPGELRRGALNQPPRPPLLSDSEGLQSDDAPDPRVGGSRTLQSLSRGTAGGWEAAPNQSRLRHRDQAGLSPTGEEMLGAGTGFLSDFHVALLFLPRAVRTRKLHVLGHSATYCWFLGTKEESQCLRPLPAG